MEDRDDLSTYPKGWMETLLGNIVNPSDKKVEPSTLQQVPYVGLEHIEKNTGKLLDFGNSSEVKSTKSKFYPGDLLYGKLRPYLNKVHCVNFEGVCSTDILVFSKQPYISNEFLSFRFLCKDFVSYASQNVNGVQHPRVNFQSLSEFPIHLPPLNEQRRIVAKIEALKARSQRVKEALEDIPQLLDQFRQSVLAAAFRGDLTADWREQNPDVEPASVLLERIQEKRQNWYEEECIKAEKEGRKKPKDHSKNKKSTHTSVEINAIPDTWAIARLEEISYLVTDGTHKTPRYQTEGIPFLSVKNVRPFVVKDVDIKFISQEEYQEINARCNPEKGDILYTKVGATFGYAAINRLDYPFSIFVSLALIKPVHPYFLSKYAEVVMNSEIVFSQARQRVTGIGTPDLHLIEIRDFRIPLPPLEEQEEIVNRVHTFLKVVNRIEQQYKETKSQLSQLDQSILAKAFRGELVLQDPNDEPASVLLERIRAERAKLQTKAANKSTPPIGGRRSKKASQQEAEPVQLELGLE